MLDPDCGFCFLENGTNVYDSSCVPVNQSSTDHAAWARSDIWVFLFLYKGKVYALAHKNVKVLKDVPVISFLDMTAKWMDGNMDDIKSA